MGIEKMSKKKNIGLALVLALVLTGILLVQSRKYEISHAPTPESAVMKVIVTKARQGVLRKKVPYLAQVLSDKSISLSTKLSGYVEKVYVEEAQKVKKGDLLVSIDAIELNASISGLKATLNAQVQDVALAKSMYGRNIKLFKIGGLSKESLETSNVAFKSKLSIMENTKQQIAQLQHQRSYLTILAPFDGEIDAILLHEGDLAASSKPILSMSTGEKKLVFSYASGQAFIQKGQVVFSKGKTISATQIGTVKSIYTISKNGLLSAEVALTSTLTDPVGSSINIEVLTGQKKGCLLPINTMIHKKESIFVMAYKEEKFYPLKVNILMQDDSSILVTPCPKVPVAQASEVKLAQLPAYKNIKAIESSNE